ncbi:uncharacterized protein [Heterodontus francisci]|uniref:uncharacterized protein n=1 Tax=Heterodontus francisci TaxID=7792 RepID=UPI00355AD93B
MSHGVWKQQYPLLAQPRTNLPLPATPADFKEIPRDQNQSSNAQQRSHQLKYLVLFVAAIMTCLVVIIQALPCVSVKRKQQREKSDHVRVGFAPSHSGLVESNSCSEFFLRQTVGSDGGDISFKGQPTTLLLPLIPRLSVQSLLVMEMTTTTEYQCQQKPAQPKEKSLSSLNTRASGTKPSILLPSAPWSFAGLCTGSAPCILPCAQSPIPLSNLNPTFSLGLLRDQGLKPPCGSRERGLSSESNTVDGDRPKKESVSQDLLIDYTPQSVLESSSNPGSPAVPSAKSLSLDLVIPITEEGTKTLPTSHLLVQTPGTWVLVTRESQVAHQTPNSSSCLQDKSPKPNSSLKGLAGQNSEISVTTPNPNVAIASSSASQMKRSPGGGSAGLQSTRGASDQNRLHANVVEDDGPFTISHLANSLHLGSPGVNVNKDYSMKQTSSLMLVPRQCESPPHLPVPSPSLSNLEWKSEPSLAAPSHTGPSKCDEFVEIPLDEVFPSNPKMLPESKACLGISQPLSEFCTKILPSLIFNCFHNPTTEKLQAPVGKRGTPASSNTLSFRVESDARGSETGLDTGDAWGKILTVSRSNNAPLPWGKTFTDLLFQELFKPTEILKGNQLIPTGRTEWDEQIEHQLPFVKNPMSCNDQGTTKCAIPVNKDVLMYIPAPGQSSRAEQFVQTCSRQSSFPWAGAQCGLK